VTRIVTQPPDYLKRVRFLAYIAESAGVVRSLGAWKEEDRLGLLPENRNARTVACGGEVAQTITEYPS